MGMKGCGCEVTPKFRAPRYLGSPGEAREQEKEFLLAAQLD
jgi:hypothetical protein